MLILTVPSALQFDSSTRVLNLSAWLTRRDTTLTALLGIKLMAIVIDVL